MLMTYTRLRVPALLVAAGALALAAGCSGGSTAAAPGAEQQDVTAAVVPAVDSAGFFVALHDGLFKAAGLHVTFVPAISSETVIDQQELSRPGSPGEVDISCGNYVSYIQAQQAWDRGQRPRASDPRIVAANLDIFAEGSVMEPGTVAIYTMPGSRISTLADLRGKTIAINAPDNILYLLVASALADHGISPSQVRFVTSYAFPAMAGALRAGKVDAAVLPEPFASAAEQQYGAVPMTDLDQGAAAQFPIEGYAVTKAWAKAHPKTLAAFYRALEQGQEIADTDRSALQQAMEGLPPGLAVPAQTAAVMAVPDFPVAEGPAGAVDKVQLQRVADVMAEFLAFPAFNVKTLEISG
jgi:NitT/TauT family transport system substrate-binding protein